MNPDNIDFVPDIVRSMPMVTNSTSLVPEIQGLDKQKSLKSDKLTKDREEDVATSTVSLGTCMMTCGVDDDCLSIEYNGIAYGENYHTKAKDKENSHGYIKIETAPDSHFLDNNDESVVDFDQKSCSVKAYQAIKLEGFNDDYYSSDEENTNIKNSHNIRIKSESPTSNADVSCRRIKLEFPPNKYEVLHNDLSHDNDNHDAGKYSKNQLDIITLRSPTSTTTHYWNIEDNSRNNNTANFQVQSESVHSSNRVFVTKKVRADLCANFDDYDDYDHYSFESLGISSVQSLSNDDDDDYYVMDDVDECHHTTRSWKRQKTSLH
jgi:hypothetical protein